MQHNNIYFLKYVKSLPDANVICCDVEKCATANSNLLPVVLDDGVNVKTKQQVAWKYHRHVNYTCTPDS